MAVAQRAIDCIDTSELPDFARLERAGEVTACLKEILDRVELPSWEQIPDAEEIRASVATAPITAYRLPDTRITIAKVEEGSRKHEYLFSPGTVDRAVDYFHSIEPKPYRTDGPAVSEGFYQWYVSAPGHPALARFVDGLPDILRRNRTLGMANWKWSGLLLTLFLAVALLTAIFRAYFPLASKARETGLFPYWLTLVFPIAAILVPVAVKHVSYHYLTLRGNPLYITDFATILTAMLIALVLIFATSNRIAATVIASPFVNPAGLNAQLIKILSQLASFGAAVVLFIVGGQHLGIPIATLLTSAGIGGVAIALGAQDTLRSLFGTINLLADKPFRVGDRIVFRTYDGVVEDIGLRSTSLRLLSGHQVRLPNDQLAGNDIENIGRRPFIRRVGTIHLPIDSSSDKLVRAVAIIREELDDHEGMDPERPPRVYFDEFSANAFMIQFHYWYSPPDFWKFKAFGDRLNLRIFRKFEAEGIQFSLPIRHSFWKHDNVEGPLDVNLLGDLSADRA